MRDIVTPTQIYPALQALLGLPDHCISFELRVAAGQYGVTVACEHYLSLDAPGIAQLESVLSEYELVKRAEAAPANDERSASAIGFDAWMRERTDRAHAEYMARHAAGGVDYRRRTIQFEGLI